MERILFFFFFLFIYFLVAVFADSANSVDSFGGNITQVNISFLQTTDRWIVYYGFSSGSSLSPINTSSNTTLLNLANTYLYYLITDQPSIPSGEYLTPSLAEVDEYFNLSGYSSSSYIFDNTSNFSILVNGNLQTFELPALFFSGKNSDNSTNPYAFKSGIIKKGEKFLFVVLANRSLAEDGNYYDFIFALPTNPEGLTYSVFSVQQPTTKSEQQSTETQKDLFVSWSYDGQKLLLNSLASTNILLTREDGVSYSIITDAKGEGSIFVEPGFKYYLSASKSGYKSFQTVLYIPKPLIIQNITTEQTKNQTFIVSEENQTKIEVVEVKIISDKEEKTMYLGAGGSDAIKEGKILICFENDCYFSDEIEKENLEQIRELSCLGNLCKLEGINKIEFIKKYDLKSIELKSKPAQKQDFVLDLSSAFGNMGYRLSQTIGSINVFLFKEQKFLFYFFVFFSTLAVILYALLNILFKKKIARGHD